ncbi:hypothetical protein BDV18DRAFT_50292 [Aspergillus unguis]
MIHEGRSICTVDTNRLALVRSTSGKESWPPIFTTTATGQGQAGSNNIQQGWLLICSLGSLSLAPTFVPLSRIITTTGEGRHIIATKYWVSPLVQRSVSPLVFFSGASISPGGFLHVPARPAPLSLSCLTLTSRFLPLFYFWLPSLASISLLNSFALFIFIFLFFSPYAGSAVFRLS